MKKKKNSLAALHPVFTSKTTVVFILLLLCSTGSAFAQACNVNGIYYDQEVYCYGDSPLITLDGPEAVCAYNGTFGVTDVWGNPVPVYITQASASSIEIQIIIPLPSGRYYINNYNYPYLFIAYFDVGYCFSLHSHAHTHSVLHFPIKPPPHTLP